jgi:methoxymalonate biosynthesis acyl carrier protein
MATGARDELVDQVLEYLNTLLTSGELGADDDCFASGLVNSLQALEIVTFVERTFRVSVAVDDLDLDNFRSAASIATFVRHKRMAPATATAIEE